MNKARLSSAWGAGALACVLLLGAAGAAEAPDAPPAPSAPPLPAVPSVKLPNQAEIDAQLRAAQKQLEEAAHEVARLSTEFSGSVMEEFMPLLGAHVVMGVQLEPAPGNVGARVREVSPGGPAAQAGLLAGDVIVAVNGTELKGDAPARQVNLLLRDVKPDTPVSLRVQRAGRPLALTVTVRGAPDLLARLPRVHEFGVDVRESSVQRSLRDMELATLTPGLGSYFGTDKGVLVLKAPADGAFKLEDGDVILAIDGRSPESGSHAARILGSYVGGEKISLRVLRQHKTLDLEMTIPDTTRAHDVHRREGVPPAPDPHVTRAAPPRSPSPG
jgi:predicted metalloprotease with PDZ domain